MGQLHDFKGLFSSDVIRSVP